MSTFQCFNTKSTLMSLQQALSVAVDQISGFRNIPLQELILLQVDYLKRCLLIGERTSKLV